MRIGVRGISPVRSLKARTTGKIKRKFKKSINPLYGVKGIGLANDPKKAMYNKVYNRTTCGVKEIVKPTTNKQRSSGKQQSKQASKSLKRLVIILLLIILFLVVIL